MPRTQRNHLYNAMDRSNVPEDTFKCQVVLVFPLCVIIDMRSLEAPWGLATLQPWHLLKRARR